MSKAKKKKKNKHWLFWLIILTLAIGSMYLVYRPRSPADVEYYVMDRELREITVGNHTLGVEVVTSPSSLSQGLSGRDKIGADGMLFLIAKKRVMSFWMKEMQFDLDIIWIADEEIVGIAENVPKPEAGASLSELPTYTSPVPVNAVLEVPAGTVKRLGLKVGDYVNVPILAP